MNSKKACSEEKQIFSGNLKTSPGITGRLGKIFEKHEVNVAKSPDDVQNFRDDLYLYIVLFKQSSTASVFTG